MNTDGTVAKVGKSRKIINSFIIVVLESSPRYYGGLCAFCASPCYTKCTKCQNIHGKNPFLCFFPGIRQHEGKNCFLPHHNTMCGFSFGVADQQHYLGETRSSWVSHKPKHFQDQRSYMEEVTKWMNLDGSHFAPSEN
jgi:hypothetical protein